MMHNFFRTHIPLTLFLLLFLGGGICAHAADTELIVTWKANNFYPLSFTKKALPTYGTELYFAVEEIQDGKLVDLSNATIEWRKNDERVKIGQGQKEALVVFDETDRVNFVSVAVTLDNNTVQKSVSIPVTQPQLILETPYPNMAVPPNTNITIIATPYFFNAKTINDFSFSWIVNGIKKGTGSNNKLIINTGNPGSSLNAIINIFGYVQNKRSVLEIVKTQKRLLFNK